MGSKAFGCEVQLLRAAWTSNGGATITLQFADESDWEPFREMTVKAGKHAGQRLMAAFSRITDDEQEEALPPKKTKAYMMPDGSLAPAPDDAVTGHVMTEELRKAKAHPSAKAHFPPGLTGLAVMWSKDEHFQNWLWDAYPNDRVEDMRREEWAKEMICGYCEVGSRKDLDTNKEAGEKFNATFRHPYQAYLKEHPNE